MPLSARSDAVDAIVGAEWGRLSGPVLAETALAAVGGYGRRELFPHSDIDLLFVTADEHAREALREPLAPLLRDLWDRGLRVSQSVHTVEECLRVDERNVEFSVSLLDRRFLHGNRALFDSLRDPKRERLLPALVRLTRDRHQQFGNTIYHLEPHVKEGPGGMRDLQVLRWLAHLTGRPATVPPHELLFRIRGLLHRAAGRDQNVLNFPVQDEAAIASGFPDAAALMRAYYREARPLFRSCVRLLDEAEERRSPLLAAFRDRSARYKSADFSAVNGRVYFRVPPTESASLVNLFEFVARHGIPLSRDAEDRVAQFASVAISGGELLALFELPHAAMAIRAMHETGFLPRVFPELEAVESLVIRDFYHRYTVDEHTMIAVETAEALRANGDSWGDLARETQSWDALVFALLFHDVGKAGEGPTHAPESASVAREASNRLGVDRATADTALFLIEHHLEMSRLMTTRDLTDPATAATLAGIVGTVERLKLLTVFTYCDISAVNPEAMTPWRATLLWRLFLATSRYLTLALGETTEAEGMPTRYALVHSAEEIEEHRRMESEGTAIRLERDGATYRLTIVTKDRPSLFADIAGALASFGMNILRAEAFTNVRRFVIDTFTFADPMRTLELNPSDRDRLQSLMRDVLAGRKKVEHLLKGRVAPRSPVSQQPGYVWFDNTNQRASLFEITAQDRPGLLFDLAHCFSNSGCNIEVVLIDTQGRKAIDVFYVTREGKPLDDIAAKQLSAELERAANAPRAGL